MTNSSIDYTKRKEILHRSVGIMLELAYAFRIKRDFLRIIDLRHPKSESRIKCQLALSEVFLLAPGNW